MLRDLGDATAPDPWLIGGVLTFLLALAACAEVTPEYFKGPNGRDAYVMRCSGLGRTWAKCYAKAGEICPSGYEVVGQQSGTVAVPVEGGIIAAPRQTLVVECK